MLEKAKKLSIELDILIDSCAKSMNVDYIKNMDSTDLIIIQKIISVIDITKELLVEEAKNMEEQNKKLDLLLQKMDELAR